MKENHIPFDLQSLPPWWKCTERIFMYCCLLPAAFITPTAVGFDLSMTNALQTIPMFEEHFNYPRGAVLGFFGAAQSLGGVIAVLIGAFIADRWGRRFPIFLGSLVVIGSTFGQVWALNFQMFCAFKLVLGFGISITQLGSPVLVAELAHPKERVAITNLYNTTMFIGNIIGSWIAFGTYSIETDWSWRIPCLLQIVCSTYQLFFIYLCPESPRWLVAHGRADEAKRLLIKYHAGGDSNSDLVKWEFAEISDAISMEKAVNPSVKEILTNKGLLWRAFICICCGCFSQTSGNGLVSSYLVPILKSVGITDTKTVTLINGGVSIWSWVVGVLCAIFTSRFRRRTVLITGSTMMLVLFIGWTVAQARYDLTKAKGSGYAVIALIFLFNAAYAFAWLYMVVAYPIEIAPYRFRARLWALVVLCMSLSAFFNQYVNPIGLENAGWKYYVYYDVWIAMEIIIIYFMFPETSGRSLEEIAVVFDGESAAVTTSENKLEDLQHIEHVTA